MQKDGSFLLFGTRARLAYLKREIHCSGGEEIEQLRSTRFNDVVGILWPSLCGTMPDATVKHTFTGWIPTDPRFSCRRHRLIQWHELQS